MQKNDKTVMNRRKALRRGLLVGIGAALGKFDALKAEGGQLTVDLNQWSRVIFTYQHETMTVGMAEVWATLRSGT